MPSPDPYWPDPYLGELDYDIELPEEDTRHVQLDTEDVCVAGQVT